MIAKPRARFDMRRWITWFGVLVMVAAGMLTVRDQLDKAQVALAFLLVVLWGSSAGGRALGVSLASAAFLVFNWFFLPPYNTLIISNPLDWLVLIVFLITGVTAAQLLERMRQQAQLAEQRAEEIDRIATLGSETLNAPRAESALDAIAAVIRAAMRVETCLIYLRTEEGTLRLAGRAPQAGGPEVDAHVVARGVAPAQTAAERADGSVALLGDAVHARSRDAVGVAALTHLRALDIPLTVRERLVGALRISSSTPFSLSEDQRRVLGALSYYAALGAERVRLAAAEEQAEALRRADRLKDSLLAAVSHDLRTPLTAIKGIANEVWRGGDPERAFTIEQEADRLTALVDDLLELSQLNAGSRPVDVALNTVDDVVGAALERVEAAHGVGRIHVEIVSDGAILVGAFDFGHTMRALTNLLENALKYSPADSPVGLKAWRSGDVVRFAVSDEGRGVPVADRDRIFEPFYRGNALADGVRGTGLGLAIARQLAEAQGGALVYESAEGTGSRFILSVKAAAGPAD